MRIDPLPLENLEWEYGDASASDIAIAIARDNSRDEKVEKERG